MTKNITPRNPIFRPTPKNQYLKEIHTRLDTEYIKILELVTEHNLTHERGIGFWSLIRIIFPVIETVAFVVGKQKEEFLEKELQVPYGFLVWEIYRHSLMHGDELRYAIYKDKTISWAAHLGNEDIGHIVVNHTDTHPTTIHVAIPKLYYTLQDFLKKEIEKNDTSIINIQVGVNYPDNKSKVISQLEEIINKY